MGEKPDSRLVRVANVVLEKFEAHCRRHRATPTSCPEPFPERGGRRYTLGYGEALSQRGLVVRVVGPRGESADPLCDLGTDVRLAAFAHLEPLLLRIREEERAPSAGEVEDARRREEEDLLAPIPSLRGRIAGSGPPA